MLRLPQRLPLCATASFGVCSESLNSAPHRSHGHCSEPRSQQKCHLTVLHMKRYINNQVMKEPKEPGMQHALLNWYLSTAGARPFTRHPSVKENIPLFLSGSRQTISGKAWIGQIRWHPFSDFSAGCSSAQDDWHHLAVIVHKPFADILGDDQPPFEQMYNANHTFASYRLRNETCYCVK